MASETPQPDGRTARATAATGRVPWRSAARRTPDLVRARIRGAGFRGSGIRASWVREWIRSAPGTHLWLLVLTVTTAVVGALPRHRSRLVLHHISTNLVELHDHPLLVLIASALCLESPSGLLTYAVLFELVHAPAERVLGTRRWLFVAAVAHVGATLVSQRAVLSGIHDERLPQSLARTVDVGVSYGLAGVVGVLAYRVPRPWRLLYVAGVLAFFGGRLVAGGTFTDLGHLTAALIGLGCYPVQPLRPARRAAPSHRPTP